MTSLYKGKMWAKQAELPPLPVPKLQDSAALFLESVEPLVSPAEMEKTRILAKELVESPNGKLLQEMLEEQAKKCNQGAAQRFKEITEGTASSDALHPDLQNYPNTHWLENWWEKLAYLAWPETLLWSNVFQVGFGCQPCEDKRLRRFAAVVAGFLDFRDLLLSGNLPMEPGTEAGKTLCNAQQLRIISAHRVPGESCDRIVTDHMSYAHICVSCHGIWYQVQVVKQPGVFSGPSNIISIDAMEKILKMIEADASNRVKQKGPAVPLAALTTEDRPIWAKTRVLLQSTSEQSAECLRSLETALFHLLLSDLSTPPKTFTEGQRSCHRADRGREIWMDKCFTYVGFSNGVCGIHIEHSCADAVVPSRMAIHAQVYATLYGGEGVGYTHPEKKMLDLILAVPQTPFRGPSTWSPDTLTIVGSDQKPWDIHAAAPGLRRLEFHIDNAIKDKVAQACAKAEEVLSQNHVVALNLPASVIGNTSRIKGVGLAPDSFMQMVLQLAFARDQPDSPVPATYETGMTRAFLHGRTETIRTQSRFSRDFALSFDDPKVSAKDKVEAIMQAAEHHRKYTRRAVAGQGVDRHFLGLRMLAAENKITPVPGLFSSEAYAKSTNYTLSTSQMPWGTPDHPGFCAPSDAAYGVCYRFVVTGGIIATVSSRGACKTKDAERFCKQIEKSAVDLMLFLEQNKPKKDAPRSKL